MKREILDVVFENERFTVGFTTRFGGVSEAAYEGLNLGDHVGDRAWSVAKNREILANRLGICVQNLKFMRQIHSDVVFLTRSEERRVGKECRSRWSPYH